MKSNPDLQEKMNKLTTQAQKIKFMKEETTQMYKVLENSYGIEKIIELENKLKHNEDTIVNQNEVIGDL